MTSATLAPPPAATPRAGGVGVGNTSVPAPKDAHATADASADGGLDAGPTPEDDAALLKPLASPDDAAFDAGAYAGRVLAEATSSEEVRRKKGGGGKGRNARGEGDESMRARPRSISTFGFLSSLHPPRPAPTPPPSAPPPPAWTPRRPPPCARPAPPVEPPRAA